MSDVAPALEPLRKLALSETDRSITDDGDLLRPATMALHAALGEQAVFVIMDLTNAYADADLYTQVEPRPSVRDTVASLQRIAESEESPRVTIFGSVILLAAMAMTYDPGASSDRMTGLQRHGATYSALAKEAVRALTSPAYPELVRSINGYSGRPKLHNHIRPLFPV